MSGLSPADFYHTGYVTKDIEKSAREFELDLGVVWAGKPSDAVMPMILEGGEQRDLRFSILYSAAGPHHYELVQEIPGTFWVNNTDQPTVIHHHGYWSEDLDVSAAGMVSNGATLVAVDQEDSIFRYYRTTSGALIELVNTRMRPFQEEFWAASLRTA